MIPLKDENAGASFPFVTIALIAVNVGVWLYQFLLPEPELQRFIYSFGMIPAQVLAQAPRSESAFPAALTLVTSQFLHGGLFHLLGNMLYLWIFGNNIEDLLGKVRFLIFYLTCGVVAALAHLVLHPGSDLPMVGASGAIAGVLGAYLISFPRARVLVAIFLVFIITTARVPAFLVLGFWFVMQLLYALNYAGGEGTNVAYMAHVGGFLVGLWLVRKLRPQAARRRGWR